MANHPNTKEKFWSMYKARGACLEWSGTLWKTGYGRFVFKGKDWKAHRLAWVLSGEKLKDDECLLHSCDNRKCINIYHLFIGTRKENNLDKTRKGRQTKGVAVSTAKISTEIAQSIRVDSRPSKEIALQYGITWGHVNKIKRGVGWNHV